MWDTGTPAGAGLPWPDVELSAMASADHGGGNTLRIGRPEHPKFDLPGRQAARLLDLFHCGKSRSDDKSLRGGAVVRIEGHINVNTATKDTLRALAAGWLGMDGKLEKRTSLEHELGTRMAPPTVPLKLSAPTLEKEADVIAEAIVHSRPYASISQVAAARHADGKPVFGNRERYPDGTSIVWSDSAAEEVFGRVYDASTVRSRNFRVWVLAQALAPSSPGAATPEVLSEVRKNFTLFVDPGPRRDDGSIDPARCHVIVPYENNF
jgi:hypothetical protein